MSSVTLNALRGDDLRAKHEAERASSGLSRGDQAVVKQAVALAAVEFLRLKNAVEKAAGPGGARMMVQHFVELVS